MAEYPEYILEPFREEADFNFYRGRQRDNEMPILAVAVAADQPSPELLRRLEYECSLAAELDAKWAAQPVVLTRHEGRPALILKDPGGDPLDRFIEQHREESTDLTFFLRIAIGLPNMTLFRPRVREFMLESRHFENSTRTMRSGRYNWVTDLRPVGIDGLLHYSLKREENDPHEGEHKLELLDTGAKGYSALVEQVESAIEGSIFDLEVMRIDLCADMTGIPIEWFFNRLRVKFKRVGHEIGTLKAHRIGKVGIETLTTGKRPNVFRAYDKVAEYKEQLRERRRKRSQDADEITLESEFGISEKATITRLEQQFGGNRIPIEIDSFAQLRNLPGFNPFDRIEILRGTGASLPTIADCGLDHWLTGTCLRELQEEMGRQQFCRWLTKHSSRNSARWLKKYAPFLEPDNDFPVTAETVFETYRESVQKQLAA